MTVVFDVAPVGRNNIMAEKAMPRVDVASDRLSGQSISSLNEAFMQHLQGSGGLKAMDNMSEQIFPSVFGAINNCLCKPLRKHPRYANVELLWTGSTAEGVNIPNFERQGDRKPQLEFELDVLCVLRDIEVGRTLDSPAVLVQQEGTSEGYFVVYVQSPEYREKWRHFCIVPSDAKRKHEMYLNPLLIIEDLYKQIKHIFGQIPLLSERFRLEFNPPAVTLTMADFGAGKQNIIISCDLVVALELTPSCLPKRYQPWIQTLREQKWPSDDLLRKMQEQNLHLVGKCSPKGQAKVEWRLSFSSLELTIFKEIRIGLPVAVMCYRMFKMIRYWHLKTPDFLHSYHLKMIFLQACHTFPATSWTEDNLASNILGLLDNLFHCLATRSLPSYFLPDCNLIEQVHPDFIFTLLEKLSQIRKDPTRYIINLQR